MTQLTIRLLGTPEVSFGERPLAFRTRKVLALLIYLVVQKRMHSRESLMALLWPETEAQKAAVTLRGTLSRLRRALQPVGNVLITEAGKVGFDFDCSVELDLDWLAAAVLAATPPDELVAVQHIDRGEFLAGFSLPDAPQFDTWAAIERQTCQRQVEAVYDRLTRHHLDRAEASAAADTAVHWLARAPLNETAYRRLMAAQALSGDRAAALATYAQCQTLLRQELSLEPAPKTSRLAERIRLGTLPTSTTDPAKPTPFSLPFVGRAEEQGQLAAAFRQSGTSVCVVIGAGGVGKTRLISAFLEWATLNTPDVEIWEGRAFEMGGRLPFEPVIEALRLRLEQKNAPEDMLEDVWLAELSQLMPELRGRYPDLPSPMTGDANFVRSRLFAAVATLGTALAANHPAIFILADMQWADADTLDMVHYLSRRWAEGGVPIFLLLAVRQENFAADTALREWLTRLDRDAPLTRLLLDPLSGTAVQQLVESLATGTRHGSETSPTTEIVRAAPGTSAFANWVWAETNGLPFFVEALLQMLIEQGLLAAREGGYDFAAALQHVQSAGHVPLPPGVRDVVLARLERLSEHESALLLAAAVLGRECSFTRLCRVADLGEMVALPALEELLNGRLLAENGTPRRPYSLAHDYIRQVVYEASGEARRRVLHRRALIDLEADSAPAAECAHHAAASLLDEPTFRFSLAAGDEAMAAHALQESLAHYARALEAARAMGLATTAIAAEPLCRLYESRGRILELTYQYEDAQANYLEMLELAENRGDLTLKKAALTALCVIHATSTPMFNPTKARELGETALHLSQESNDREAEARAFWSMMLVEFLGSGETQKALTYGEKAISLARELGLKELQGFISSNLAYAYMAQEKFEVARQANQEAQAIWLALNNLPMAADAYTIKMGIQHFTGEYEAILATAPEALRLSLKIGNLLHQNQTLNLQGLVHGRQGRLGQAIASIEQAMSIDIGEEAIFSAGGYWNLSIVHLLNGMPNQAEVWADKLFALRESFGPPFDTFMLTAIASVKVTLGKLKEGEAVLKQAWVVFNKKGSPTFTRPPLFVADGQLQLALGNQQGALERMRALIQRLSHTGSRYYLAEAFWLHGKAWLALEEVEQARESLRAAKKAAEVNSERAILWQILADLADIEAQIGIPEEAERLREQAREIITFVADHIGSDELRATFLHSPEVQAIVL